MNSSSIQFEPIPMLDLGAQYRPIKEEIKAAIDRVLESQHFILGPEVKALEQERKARRLETIPETIRSVLGEYFKTKRE